MRTLKRSPSTAVTLTAPAGTASRGAATPACAASYHCKTSTRSVYDATYQGFGAEEGHGYGRHQFATSPAA